MNQELSVVGIRPCARLFGAWLAQPRRHLGRAHRSCCRLRGRAEPGRLRQPDPVPRGRCAAGARPGRCPDGVAAGVGELGSGDFGHAGLAERERQASDRQLSIPRTRSTYAPSVLIAIRSRADGDAADAKTFGVDDLAALGGDFEPFAQALSDGHADCEELGLDPLPPVTPSEQNAEGLLKGGPVVGRCVVKVLGTGLFSIEGEVADRDARRIHACSDRIARAARREHAQLRARTRARGRTHRQRGGPPSASSALASTRAARRSEPRTGA